MDPTNSIPFEPHPLETVLTEDELNKMNLRNDGDQNHKNEKGNDDGVILSKRNEEMKENEDDKGAKRNIDAPHNEGANSP
jgi:hypothetical protein